MTTQTRTVTNGLSFDLEHWYMATLVRDSVSNPIDRIESSVDYVLSILNDHDVTATFFIVGEVAESYPDLVSRIAEAGHELGTHGQTHTSLFDLDRKSFATELDQSVAAIERAADISVKSFRAPNFSLTAKTAWAFEVLTDKEFIYDSSVFPVKTPMYGVGNAPVGPYSVNNSQPFTPSSENTLVEAPLAVHPRFKLPAAGGFYARFLPTRIAEWGINALNARQLPAVLYFHPWEFNPAVRSNEPPAHARWISYYGLEETRETLNRLLEQYSFDSILTAIQNSR